VKKLLLFACLATCFSKLSYAQETYWQQEVHYTIDVSLNDVENTLDGFLKLRYINHSPDTLSYIWFHIWPNAYKNDQTAFSEQHLQNGKTDFYFADKDNRGYINHLDFRVDNSPLKTEDHPTYIDVIKVYLANPLPPGASTELTTPFHAKLPYNYSRGGHVGRSYQITQWYPKPAVYDKYGWHPMPYLDQGEFYSEFGNFDIRITIPKNYVVAATGELQDDEEKKWMISKHGTITQDKVREAVKKGKFIMAQKPKPQPKKLTSKNKKSPPKIVQQPVVVAKPAPVETKTLRYIQDNVHDFAWFADKNLIVNHDTVQLASGKIVEAYSFYHSAQREVWKNSIQMMKDAVRFRSALIGEYPYNTVNAVESNMGVEGGMEYPTITCISPMPDPKTLDRVLEHEIGHNWFYGALGSNERDHPWMDEGINTYYDGRYGMWKYGDHSKDANTVELLSLENGLAKLLINALAKEKKDQPIATPSVDFSEVNYGLMAYFKAGYWMQQLEDTLTTSVMDSCMQAYFNRWKFKHPQPEDFKAVIESTSGKNLDASFSKLQQKGPLTPERHPKKIKPAFLLDLKNTYNTSYINFFPAVGFNQYDGFMIGAAIHNFSLPRNKLEFVVVPLYGTRSKQFNAIGGIHYNWYPGKTFEKIGVGLTGERFSFLKGTDSNGTKIFGGFSKLAPFIRFTFANTSPRSTREKWIEWKTFLIGEKGFDYVLNHSDSTYYPSKGAVSNRYLNQLTYYIGDYRALYPFDVQFQVQQGAGFYRATATANYFFNYTKEGGASVRFFAGKFGFIGGKTITKEFETYAYQPKLTAVRGNEDYTYSNYFVGRNEIDGAASQQIMMRDGGLKIRTDLFQGLQGRSEDWIAAMNFNTTIPSGILPKVIPLRIFVDIGTYAEAWEKDAATSRFLYVGGLQLSLFKDLINVYAPLIYSSEFRNNLKTVPEENKFLKKISFSIDIQRFNLRRLSGNKIPL